MKIPGYKHLVEDILPDLRICLPEIITVYKGTDLVDITENFDFIYKNPFGNIIRYSLKELLTNKEKKVSLRCILSVYLWFKYTRNGEVVNTDIYKFEGDGNYFKTYFMLPGEPYDVDIIESLICENGGDISNFDELDDLSDEYYITIYCWFNSTEGDSVIPSKALDPVEVASWPIIGMNFR